MTELSYPRLIAVLSLCVVWPAPRIADAQPTIAPDSALLVSSDDAPPIYEVEFLIFAYNAFNPLEEEFPRAVPKWPKALTNIVLMATPETLQPGSAAWYLDNLTLSREPDHVGEPALTTETLAGPALAEPSASPRGNTIGTASASTDDGRWYRMLDDDALELNRATARLAALDAYTPLLHAGWAQQTFLEENAMPFELAWLGRLRPAGTIRLHRSRFLHLTIDVSLQDSYRYRQEPVRADSRWPLAEFRGPTRYSIRAQRRIRSGELHFFDHPAFGILILVRPTPAVPDAADPAAEAPAA